MIVTISSIIVCTILILFFMLNCGGQEKKRIYKEFDINEVKELSSDDDSVSAYGIVVWAMQHSPIALVSALRESSVVIAALMSIWILKEETTEKYLLPAVMVAAGVIMTRL